MEERDIWQMLFLYFLYQASMSIALNAQRGKTWVINFSTHLLIWSLLANIFLTWPKNYFQFTLVSLGSLSPFTSSALYYVFVIWSFEKFLIWPWQTSPQSVADCIFKDGHTNMSKSYVLLLMWCWHFSIKGWDLCLLLLNLGRTGTIVDVTLTSETRTQKMMERLPS